MFERRTETIGVSTVLFIVHLETKTPLERNNLKEFNTKEITCFSICQRFTQKNDEITSVVSYIELNKLLQVL